MKRMMLVPLALGFALSGATVAFANPAPQRAHSEASIPFANHGAVETWEVENDHTIWFEDSHRRWYRATLMGRAIDLPFSETIGIDSSPSGNLDRWSSIVVKGQRYNFTAFEAMPGPPPKHAHHHKGLVPVKKPG